MWSRICCSTVLKSRDTSFTSLGSPAYRLSLESTAQVYEKEGERERERERERGGVREGEREREREG